MDFNRLLAQLLGTHQGSWGTPELGLSEGFNNVGAWVQGAEPVRSADGGSQAILNPNSQADRQQIQNAVSNSRGSVQGARTTAPIAPPPVNNFSGGGGGGGGNQPTPGGGGQDELALAEAARRNRINSYKAQAGNLRGQAQGTFDNILKAVNAFRDRTKTQFSNAGQEITNRASEILGSNARTAEEVSGDARARGRALGLGDSSKFNLQNKVQGNLAATQGATIARRGEEDRSNQNLFQERQDEAQSQENEANSYLRNAMDRATTIENTGYDAGEEVFANSLNDIVNYQRNLAAINPVNANGLTQYNPNFGGIANTLNGILGGLNGNTQTQQETGNPANPVSVFELLKRKGLVQG